MLLYNNRMVEGTPLHYYAPVQPQFAFFRATQHPIMTEEVILPHSPNSAQSDSDNSLSSVEISSRPYRSIENKEIRCCWINCGTTFDTLDQLSTHVTRVHASSGPGGLFHCGWEGCTRNNRGFNARYKMLVHVRTHTNEKPHKCDKCEKSFSRAENLKIHSRSHSGEKPYVCPVPGCNKAYSNSSDRFKHTRTHQVEKPYQCKVPGCPKRYTDPSSLRKHVKTYKHFVSNDQNSAVDGRSRVEVPVTPPRQVQVETAPLPSNDRRIEDDYTLETSKELPCTRPCCMGKRSDLLRFEAYFHYTEEEPWVKYLQRPYEREMKKAYEIRPEIDHSMDVDMPLDLSMTGRRFS